MSLLQADEPMDGIVYGTAAGLGFASIENAHFLAGSGEQMVVLARAFTATLAHACLTGGLGFCLAMARLRRGLAGPLWAAGGLLGAVFLHGTYDLFVFGYPQANAVALLVVLPALLIALSWKIRWSQRVSGAFHPGPPGRRSAPARTARR